jgi:hypothetical protein
MTTVHDEFLELAAAAIDFELSRDERAAPRAPSRGLQRVPAPCGGLRRRPDAIARLPRYVLGPATATAVRGRIMRRGSTQRPTLRLLAAAAMLALLALAALAAGAQMIRRDHDLTEVAPTIAPSPGTPALPPVSWPPVRRSTSSPRPSGAHRADRGRFEVGQARTAPQPWRPAPDPRRAGHG